MSGKKGNSPLSVAMNLAFHGESAGGIGRYARELVGALLVVEPQTRLIAFTHRNPPEELRSVPWAQEVRWVQLPVSTRGKLHLAAQFALLPALARRHGADLIHSPANVGPPIARLPTVLTLHDLVWIHHPDEWESRRAAAGMRVLALGCARRSNRVIAISNATRDDLVRTAGLSPDKLDVVPHGVRPVDSSPALGERVLRRRLGLGKRQYILCVAQKRPYKNQEALVRALPALDEVDLVLPGSSTPYERELRTLAERLGVADRLHLPPWVDDAELDALYRAAACVALPSRFEGFGMPVLEAMAYGIPVACSDAWSLPEVAGDAALLFDPRSDDSVREALTRLLRDNRLREDLVRRGAERIHSFTWEHVARATFAVYRRAMAA